jgi:hypothetical protein
VDWRCSFSCIWRSSGMLSENLQVRHRPCLMRVNDGGMLKISTEMDSERLLDSRLVPCSFPSSRSQVRSVD